MEELYAIVVKREKKSDYFWPVSLEIIDEYFINCKRVGVLEIMRQNDSVLTETNPDTLSIKKIVGDKLIEDKNTRIIEDPFVLRFPLDKLFEQIDQSDINRIHNHLIVYKSKKVSFNFKMAIDLLKSDKKAFLNKFSELTYSEQRIIRSIINNNVDIYQLLEIKEKKVREFTTFQQFYQDQELMNCEEKTLKEPVIILERAQKNDKEAA